MNTQKTICFDVDGTLIDHNDWPRKHVVAMLDKYQRQGWKVIVWSGGGEHYAEMVGQRIGLTNVSYSGKIGSIRPDIAVDDMDVSLGVQNIKV